MNLPLNTNCRILEGAQKLFSRFGLKSVTMDDIAKDLGVSKKTIYQLYADKNDLVKAYMVNEREDHTKNIEEIVKSSKNAIEEIILTMQFMSKTFNRINPNLFYDMQKYHPQSWAIFREFKEKFMTQLVVQNIEKGKSEGLYRSDINTKIMARFRLEQVEMAMNPSIFPADKYNHTEVQIQLLDHFMHGICTLKGHKLINKYKQIDEE